MIRVTALHFIVVSLLLWGNAVQAAGLNFPGEHPEVLAPGGKYSVRYQLVEAKGPYGPHGLFLVNKESGESKLILGFERSADVLWSPDGQFLAVTNWFGSNVSEVFIFKVATIEKADIRGVLKKNIGVFPWTTDIENLSEYFEALSWETPSRLKFLVRGHGLRKDKGVENFEEFYIYDTSGTIKKPSAK
jgi:hypothetical protein